MEMCLALTLFVHVVNGDQLTIVGVNDADEIGFGISQIMKRSYWMQFLFSAITWS